MYWVACSLEVLSQEFSLLPDWSVIGTIAGEIWKVILAQRYPPFAVSVGPAAVMMYSLMLVACMHACLLCSDPRVYFFPLLDHIASYMRVMVAV